MPANVIDYSLYHMRQRQLAFIHVGNKRTAQVVHRPVRHWLHDPRFLTGSRNALVNLALAFAPSRIAAISAPENEVAALLLLDAFQDLKRPAAEGHNVPFMVFGPLGR